MANILDWFKGKKTYIMGGVAIIGAVASFLVGEIDLQQAIAAVWAGITAMTMKAAIVKSAP